MASDIQEPRFTFDQGYTEAEAILAAAPDLVAEWMLGHRLIDENDGLLAEAIHETYPALRPMPAEFRTALLRLAKEG
jgi:hypothetical protein